VFFLTQRRGGAEKSRFFLRAFASLREFIGLCSAVEKSGVPLFLFLFLFRHEQDNKTRKENRSRSAWDGACSGSYPLNTVAPTRSPHLVRHPINSVLARLPTFRAVTARVGCSRIFPIFQKHN
jgi:hypothetical protein